MSTINVNTISPQSGSNLSLTSTKLTGSLTSTASFGTYIGDGGQLSGIETLQRTGSDEVSGSARVFGPTSLTGSLIVSGSNIEYTNKLSGSLNSTASFDHLQTAGNIVFSGSKHEMNGELNLHGGSSNEFVMKALYGDGSVNADMTYRNPLTGANGGALAVRGYYLGVNSKILSLGANTGAEYWSFTSTALNAAAHSIIKAAHISASGDINITGTGSFSGSIVSTGSFGSLQTAATATSSIHGLELRKMVVGGGIADPATSTVRLNVQQAGVAVGDQMHHQGLSVHRAVHLKAGSEDFDVFIHRDSNSVGHHTGLAFGVWSANYAGKGAIFFERQGNYGVGRIKIAVDSNMDSGDVAPGDSVVQITSASLDLETGVNLSGSLTSTGSFGRVTAVNGLVLGSHEITINSTGIGLGNTNPARKFAVTETATNVGVGRFYASNGSYAETVFDIGAERAANSAYNLLNIRHESGLGTIAFRVTGEGNTGIGTGTPQSKLHVAGDIRADGDIIADNFVVSSSITHMTTSFSSGSTKFGDTMDDTHNFTGSALHSGSITVGPPEATGSLINLRATTTDEDAGITWASKHPYYWSIGTDASDGHYFKVRNGADPSTGATYLSMGGGVVSSSANWTIGGDITINNKIIHADDGGDTTIEFEPNQIDFQTDDQSILITPNHLSGSSTTGVYTTASFGTVNIGGEVGAKTLIKDNLISGSSTSTGSFNKAYATQYHMGATGIGQYSPSIRYATPAGTIGFFSGNTQFFKFYLNGDGRGILFAGGGPGYASYPAYSFDADWNTGMANPAHDNLGFYAGGTEVTRINLDGTNILHGDILFSSTGSVSGSIVSTGSFGHLVGDGGGITNLPSSAIDGTLGIFLATGSFQGTTNNLQVTGSVDVSGSFSATAKSFVIPHPAKDQGFLQHGSLEGPEHGVYVRGHLKDNDTITLPDYWDPLVDESTISVQLTPKGNWQQLFVKEVSNTEVVVQNQISGHAIDCYYVVQGERKDIPKIELEL